MALIAVAGCPGAPGATTAALALAMSWPLVEGRHVIMAECDPDGGSVVAGALRGGTPGPQGLQNLPVAARTGRLNEAFWRQLLDLSDGAKQRLVLPGLTNPGQSPGMQSVWPQLADLMAGIDVTAQHDVIADLGRRGGTDSAASLVLRADLVLAVVRTTLRGVHHAEHRVRALAEDLDARGVGRDALRLLLIPAGPYTAAEISERLSVPVAAELPFDPKAAEVLSDGTDIGERRFKRSDLMRHAANAAETVHSLVLQRREQLAPRPVHQAPDRAAIPGGAHAAR
ncbi:hypothetical protein [Streptacidiphilus jiangxiensis]|uniref:Cellulose biosynthesis protein BcsQ n=1 Tax=Streptacidiphilus jiangxiensis TaxID=235985 RepID=A0A1H8BCY6_STRJI|nr:hypothetical protein [Streptacidiphilus jiangxiensis]SEM80735.1 hypothetical protein SAMN05414137_1629 [Streptacidiphilus jiangxiensis]